MIYDTILIPLENSATDRAVITHIQPLARLCNASLILIHVADGFAARNQEALDLADSEEIAQDRAYLARIENELTAAGFKTRSILAKGDPTAEIVSAASKNAASLIAMATHGHGIVQDVLRGSVASGVRHKSNVPVLLIRDGA